MFCIPEIVAGDGPDEVVLNGFWADYDTSVVPYEPISRVKATFDYDSQTISIPAGASLGKYGDYPAYIYVSDWATDILQPDPIVLKVNAATREITYYCDRTDGTWMTPENCLIVTSYPDAVGDKVDKGVDFIGAIVMNKYNASMSGRNITTGEEGYMPVYIDCGMDSFTIYNMGGYGYQAGVTFTCDFAVGTCKAPVTLYGKDVLLSDTEKADIYFASATGGEITGSLTKGDTDGVWNVNIPTWALYDTAGGRAIVEFADGTFVIDTTYAAGIDNVAIGREADVQYFDINGRRVDNPSPGTLLIAVQGNKVSKVIK